MQNLVGLTLECKKNHFDFRVGETHTIIAHHTDGQIEIIKNNRRVRYSTDKKELDYFERFYNIVNDYFEYKDNCYIKQINERVYHAILLEDESIYRWGEEFEPGTQFIGDITINFDDYPRLMTDFDIDFGGRTGDELYRYVTYLFTMETAETCNFGEHLIVPPSQLKETLHELSGSDAIFHSFRSKQN